MYLIYLTSSLYNSGSSSFDSSRDRLWLSFSDRGDEIGEPLTVVAFVVVFVLADTTLIGSLFFGGLLLFVLLFSGVVLVV